MGELLIRVQMVLKALYAQRTYTPKTSLRLAGFASVLLLVARHEGWEAEATALLEAWNDEQMEAALEGEDVAVALSIWMSRPDWKPTTLSPEELNRALCGVAEENSMGATSWDRKATYLGIRLGRSASSYQKRFGLEIVANKHGKSHRYRFAPTPDQLSLIRAAYLPVEKAEPEKETESQDAFF